MNVKAIFGVIGLTLWSSIWADGISPITIKDAGRKPVAAWREYQIPGFVDGRESGVVCRIRFKDPYFGYLSEEDYGMGHKSPVGMDCFAYGEYLMKGKAVKYDISLGKWVRDIDNRFDPPDTKSERRRLENAIEPLQLSAKNMDGFAYTEDDLIGEENARRRVLHYCIFHPPKALCGQGEMGYVEDIKRHPDHDLTPYALKVLRSMEFLEQPAAPELPASQASSAR